MDIDNDDAYHKDKQSADPFQLPVDKFRILGGNWMKEQFVLCQM